MTQTQKLNAPPFDARAIANFLLEESERVSLPLYSTSLLKILYFGHGWHLAKYDIPLIGQPFEAWQHGPVVRVVYDQIKHISGQQVSARLTKFDPIALKEREAKADLSVETKQFLSSVFAAYGVYHPYDLSDQTHEPGSPWTQVWEKAMSGRAPGAKIENGEIRRYFLRQNDTDVVGIH